MAFDLSVFREMYPQFDSVSDEVVLLTSRQTHCYIDAVCNDDCALYLMVAHLLQLSKNIANGTPSGQITNATINMVSVTVATAPGTSAYNFWLNGTPYGIQLAALLSRCSAGGIYVGGHAERSAFRSVGGKYPNRGRYR